MKAHILTSVVVLFLGFSCENAMAQSFRKGTLLMAISEGETYADFSTRNTAASGDQKAVQKKHMCGIRDPFFFEYGITNRWGVGLSSGLDIFKVDKQTFYGMQGAGQVEVLAAEQTFDINYHLFSSKRFDLSLFGSAGMFNVSFKDNSNRYKTFGGIVRTGTRARYYFYRNIGVLAMFSTYTASCTPKFNDETNVARKYNTTLSGCAIEFGLCYKLVPGEIRAKKSSKNRKMKAPLQAKSGGTVPQ